MCVCPQRPEEALGVGVTANCELPTWVGNQMSSLQESSTEEQFLTA